ncbi:MAG: carboxypeptidase regulatory-like domain-containing protein, partial [Cyclobacteriaceae bacterium]
MMRKLLLILTMTMAVAFTAFGQGSTTSSIRGRVTDASGEALPGATVVALHKPTGVEYGNVADIEGYYRIPNIPVGGPYTITVSYVGFEDDIKQNVFLNLGQTFTLNSKLSDTALELEAVVVTAGKGEIIDGNRTGAATNISLENINSTPTVGRSVGDFARLNPQTRIEEGDDGLEISIGGMNNRLNAIYIDGAVNNDVFGLAGSGTNGGQTGVSPISIDAIQQLTVSVAPFDVRQSGFAGGSINAVTRSGTNEFEGSAYYFWRNENLAGKTPFEDGQDIERTKLPEFSAQTYGVRLGGPIIKNKVFFFVNAEFQREETPQPFEFANYDGDLTQGQIDGLAQHLRDTYNYDPGSYLDNTAFLDSDKLLAKIDWNINKAHKLTLRHSYTRAENLEARRSTGATISFLNGSEFFQSTTNSSALELRSVIGTDMSNHLTIGATLVRDDRDPFGNPFPAVFIDDGRGGVRFGSETFSTANLLDQDIITINNNFEYYKGKHTFLAGVNLEFYRTKNLFIPFNYGDYNYSQQRGIGSTTDSFLNDFLTNQPVQLYQFSYALTGNGRGDESDGAAEFNSAQYGFYIQDEYQANNKLKLVLGLRADINVFDDTPENEFFNSDDDFINGPYDLKGARTGQFIEPQVSWSPRFGFNWDVNDDQQLQIRGGVGLFTSRIPLVWPGGAFNNTGLNTGFDFERIDFTTPPVFDPNALGQVRNIEVGAREPSGNVDLFAEDFKVPQVLKYNLGVDYKLGWGMIGTVEGIFTDFVNTVYYENINITVPTDRLEGTPDDRFIGYDDIDRTYNRVILGSNTSEGWAYNLTATLTKPFDKGFAGMVSYSYGDAETIYDGTSSQNSSQWRGLHAINGRNFWNTTQRSDFAQGHRILAQVSYRKEYGGFGASQISLIYEGQSGNVFSYIYGEGDNLTGEDSRNRELVYVPNSADEIVFGNFDSDLDRVVLASESES